MSNETDERLRIMTRILDPGSGGTLTDIFGSDGAHTLNAKRDFGAQGDFVHDDTVPLREAINALAASSTQHVLVIPDGNYIVSDEIVMAGVYSKMIIGGARTVLWWRGNNASKYMLRLTNCSTVQVRQMNFWNYSTVAAGVRTEYPCAGGLFIEHATIPFAGAGQNFFELVYVQGEDPNPGATPPITGRQFENGIVAGGAVDSNNDHHRFINCRIQSVKHTAYDNQFASQAVDHTFIGCFFAGGDGYGLQSRTSFYWYGGACGADQYTGKAAFRQTSTNSNPGATVIIGANVESVQRVLVVGAEYPDTTAPAAPGGFSLIGVRWGTGLARVDGIQPVGGGALTIGTTWTSADLDGTNGTVGVVCPIWANIPGGISMTGCKFEMGIGTDFPRRIGFRVASTQGCAISAHGNQFCGDNYLVQPFIIGALGNTFALSSAVDVSGNWYYQHYTDTIGGPTYDGSVSHACADLVLSPAGSVRVVNGESGKQQAVAYASTIAFDTRYGATAHVGTLTGNVSSVSINNGRVGGERFRLILKQDANGSRTFPTSWTSNNVVYEGASKTISTAANAIDMIDMVWDGTLSFWLATLHKGYG
jgi:hypothetical protein